MEFHEVARFESAGDERRMLVCGEDGYLVVRQDVFGPSAVVAYGDEERSSRLTFGPGVVRRLLAAVPRETGLSLREFLESEGRDLFDLMDLCDALGIAYDFASRGTRSGVQLRPARLCGSHELAR